MQIMMEVSEEEKKQLIEKAKEEVRCELTEEAVIDYLKNSKNVYITGVLRELGIWKRAEALENKAVKDLSGNDKIILALKWFLYEKLL